MAEAGKVLELQNCCTNRDTESGRHFAQSQTVPLLMPQLKSASGFDVAIAVAMQGASLITLPAHLMMHLRSSP